MTTDLSDAALLRLYSRDRSDAAFAELVRRYVDLVYTVSVRRVGDRHLAEDVTQAAFIVLARRAGSLRPDAVLAGWLHRTARNIASDAIKMRERRLRHERAAVVSQPPRLVRSEPDVSPHLDAALDRLSTTDRDALLLRYVQGRSVAEVARTLGLTENTAAKRLGRAIERLRTHLADRGVTGPGEGVTAALGMTIRAPAGLAHTCAASPSNVATALAQRVLTAPGRLAGVVGLAAGLAVVATVATFQAMRSPTPAQQAAPPPLQPAAAPALVILPADEELHVRGAVDRLRHYEPFARMDDWPKAMRTLVDVGRPAVPEIVAELDRTDKDSELRAFGFTLRAIGDPRACPALIRALRRTAIVSSDLGLHLNDDELIAFIREHQTNPADTNVAFGQAVREILAAIETITSHSEGKPFRFRTGVVDEAQKAAARKRLTQLADNWQRWWDAHGSDLVTPAEMATLTAQPHDVGALVAAGNAINGPFFPTGRPYRLGPVQEVWLDGEEDRYDTRSLISFDRQEVFSQLDALAKLLPEQTVELHTSWYLDPPVSPDGQCQRYVFTLGPVPPPVVAGSVVLAPGATVDAYSLYSDVDEVWPTDNRTWDTLPSDVEAGRPITLDPRGPGNGFTLLTGGEGKPPVFPVTYLIRTAQGRAGIVQFVESSNARRQLHVRYRMVASTTATEPTTQPARKDAPPFGLVRTVTVPAAAPGAHCALSLSSGTLARAPDDPSAIERPSDWVVNTNAEVITTHVYHDTAVAGVRFVGTALLPMADQAFDRIDPAALAMAAEHVRVAADDENFLLASDLRPFSSRTAMFITHDGTAGIAQLVGVSQSPPSATLRYKLVGRAPSTRP